MNKNFFLLLTFTAGCFFFSFGQQKALTYTFINRGDSVGSIRALQKISGDDEVYTIASLVEIKVLITVRVNIQEEARYHKNKLVFSSARRIANGKLKGNKQTKATNEGYIISDNGKESRLTLKSINYDFPKLYFKEPAGISQVYSDNYQKLLAIKILSSHVYQINLPEGGSNTYYYENGTCRKIDMRSTLFNAQVILNN